MPPTVSIQGWGLTVYINRLCHPPLEPVRLLMEYGYLLTGEGVSCLTEVFTDGGSLLLAVFCDPLFQLSSCFTGWPLPVT